MNVLWSFKEKQNLQTLQSFVPALSYTSNHIRIYKLSRNKSWINNTIQNQTALLLETVTSIHSIVATVKQVTCVTSETIWMCLSSDYFGVLLTSLLLQYPDFNSKCVYTNTMELWTSVLIIKVTLLLIHRYHPRHLQLFI